MLCAVNPISSAPVWSIVIAPLPSLRRGTVFLLFRSQSEPLEQHITMVSMICLCTKHSCAAAPPAKPEGQVFGLCSCSSKLRSHVCDQISEAWLQLQAWQHSHMCLDLFLGFWTLHRVQQLTLQLGTIKVKVMDESGSPCTLLCPMPCLMLWCVSTNIDAVVCIANGSSGRCVTEQAAITSALLLASQHLCCSCCCEAFAKLTVGAVGATSRPERINKSGIVVLLMHCKLCRPQVHLLPSFGTHL